MFPNIDNRVYAELSVERVMPSHFNSSASRFEAAADAIVNGDAAALEQLLREDPELVCARSTREHGATLLHYVSANGVEDYRQRTPGNIVEITEMLLRAGAEIDAAADVYGGGYTALGLAATSIHPEVAGVQEALLQKLLDHGADLKPSIVTACLANGRRRAAEFLASLGAQLDLRGAAGLGKLEAVKGFLPDADERQLKDGFLYSCQYGRNDVVEFLLERGMDPATQDAKGQSALHWAAIGGQLDTVKLLLRHNAPLEVKNVYGGTVLGQALWSAAHGGDADVYLPILDALIAAGAELPEDQ
jgi:ankyrin repeat protein